MRLLLFVLATGLLCASPAKIAVFFAPIANSQVVFNIRFAEELAKDHDVVLIRPQINPASDKIVSSHHRVREFRTKGCTPEQFRMLEAAQQEWIYGPASLSVAWRVVTALKETFASTCYNMANDAQFIEKMRDEKFDFVFTHHVDMCSIGIIHAVGIPHWGWVMSTPPSINLLKKMGVPALPSIIPGNRMDASHIMSFWQRFKNFASEIFFNLIYSNMATTHHTATLRKAFGDDFPDLADLVERGSLMVVNSHPEVEFPIPVTSKVVYYGGLAQQKEPKPLPKPFASFISKAEKVVLVSFGTVPLASLMPQTWIDAFVELFRQNPNINFIWKFESEVQVPSNVLRVQWQPQNDILSNEKTVAFITHAGYNSIGEAIGSGTPLVTIPLFGDQHRNSQLIMYRHLGVRVDKETISFDTLNTALHKLIEDPSYMASAQELLSIQNSSPLSPGQILRSSVNFTLRFPDFDRDMPRLPLYQLYSFDCAAVLGSIVLLAVFMIYQLLKLLFRLLIRVVGSKKQKTE